MKLVNLIFALLIHQTIWANSLASFLSLWETTCKVHADSKHQELKEIIKNQDQFNISNWSHSILMILMCMVSSIILCGCCFLCYRCLLIFNPARRLKQINQLLPTHTLQKHKQDNFHFSARAPYTGRTILVREIMPQHPQQQQQQQH